MVKSKKEISTIVKLIDFWIELVDARAPFSSKSTFLDDIKSCKPCVLVLNKCDLADERATKNWLTHFKKSGINAISVNSKKDRIIDKICNVKNLIKKKGLSRAAVIGVPNVGKSCFINNIARRKKLKVENRAGVTRSLHWVLCKQFELCDTPGVLSTKIEHDVAKKLGYLGLTKLETLNIEEIAISLLDFLGFSPPREKLTEFAKLRGCLISSGDLDLNLASSLFLKDFREGKFGKITLEKPYEKLCRSEW
ncbi:MAG: 50S ribosome-binding GTPase [Firmicutes bacterium]|nr:50S ribosome-binding GTPase [Bacillota bacterium]